jgi:succinate dehydrogenase flavin-adding protein (antitoxin of CptAB toxin-antitoxin module)
MTTVDHLPPEMWEKDADKGVQTMSKRLRREKYRGIEAKEDELMRTMDELDTDLYNMLRDPNEPPAFDSGGSIGDMMWKEEQGLLAGGENYDATALPAVQSKEEEEETISFMDAVEQTEGLLGGQASFDATTGEISTKPAIETRNEQDVSPSHANDVSELDTDDDDDDEDIEVDLDELQRENPELYELLMSQEGAPSGENDDADDVDDVSPEEEAAALEQLKHEDPDLYKMLMANDLEGDAGAAASLEVSFLFTLCVLIVVWTHPVFFARYQQR